jgi:hypothetical protein
VDKERVSSEEAFEIVIELATQAMNNKYWHPNDAHLERRDSACIQIVKEIWRGLH